MHKLYHEGRPAWYTKTGGMKEPYIIGVAGGSASGKTSVCDEMIKQVGVRWVALICMDSFYNVLTPSQSEEARNNNFNFDHPTAFDIDLLLEKLTALKAGKSIELPIYDFKTHGRSKKTKYIYGADVIVLEGIFALYDERIRKLLDIQLFVETEDDLRLARRLKRDIIDRGRSLEGVLQQYERFVKPAYDDYIYPTKKYADVIIPRGVENQVAIGLLSTHIKSQLVRKGWHEDTCEFPGEISEDTRNNLHVLNQNNEIRYICTLIRGKDTPMEFFTFHVDRITRLLMEEAINLTPYEPKVVVTPTGEEYKGVSFTKKMCAVAIMRSGDAMIKPVRSIIKDIETGSILIQEKKGEGPKLFWLSIPRELKDYYIFLLDPTIGNGSTSIMAIRTLLDHGIKEEHIVFVTILASNLGINSILQLHPKVKIVCAQVDDIYSEDDGLILPSLGRFGDRYFGTEDV